MYDRVSAWLIRSFRHKDRNYLLTTNNLTRPHEYRQCNNLLISYYLSLHRSSYYSLSNSLLTLTLFIPPFDSNYLLLLPLTN